MELRPLCVFLLMTGLIHCTQTGQGVQGGTDRETEGVTGDGEIKQETARPKPAVKVQPAEHVFIGETVTLTCEIQTGESWRYLWYRNNEELSDAAGKKTHTITDIKDSDKGDYTCNGTQSSDPKYTQTSDAVTLTVSESPKPEVIIKPDTQVFIGERVTFRCDIKGGDIEWTYDWYRDDKTFNLSLTAQEIIISDYHSGNYTCRGRRRSDSQISKTSDPVTLTVSEKPKPQLTSSREGPALTGTSLTLYCTLKPPSAGWKFYWIKPTQSTETETKTHSYTISPGTVSDRGYYKCRAGRGNPVYYTHYSNELRVDVIVRPKPVVIIKPDTQVYSGERVTLRCNIQGERDTQWTYSWYKNEIEYRHHTTQEFTISSVTDSDSGKYTCRRSRSSYYQISEISDAVILTVSEKPKPELTSSLKGAVLIGNSVTLYCTLKPPSDGWKFYWSKHTQSTETETKTHSYTIRSVSVSDRGYYWCRAGRRNRVYTDYSDALWVNVTESPKPVVIIKPDTQVFIGERVTFRCEIQGGDTEWTYDWYRNDHTFYTSHTTQEIIIRDYDSGNYTCRGRRRSDSQISKMSDPVTLTVSEKPKPQLTSSLKGDVLTGNSVTLYCTLKSPSDGWKFYWSKRRQRTETETDTETDSYSRSVSVYDGGHYKCRAGRGNPAYYTDYSNELRVDVIESPKPVVIIKPDTQVFRGERVTFRCEIQGGNTEWTYDWYRNDNTFNPSHTTQEISISDYDSGKYTCRGRRRSDSQISKTSDPVTLTVSEKPKPQLTSDLKGAALTGNSVNLSCTLTPQSAGWKFYWSKHTQNPETETETHHYTINSVNVSDGGQYWCRAGRGNAVYYTDYSDALWVNVTESPKAVVTIKPDKHVFRGETVTLTCEIQGGGDTEWKYSWNKKDKTFYPSPTTQEFSFSSVINNNSGEYTCRGWRCSDNQRSEISDAVTLTVSDAAEAVVSVSPLRWLTEGDSVTLSCEVKNSSTGWTFSWYTAVPYRNGLIEVTGHRGNVLYGSELLSDSSRGSGGSYTLTNVTVNHTGVYMCRAERGESVFHTRDSNLQPLCITGESPPVSLIINPSRTQHFTADSLSLSCEDQSDSTGWTVRGYTHNETLFECSSDSGSTCNISSLSTSHSGVYWCQSESGRRSNPVNITVHNGDVILDSPVHPKGNPLILRCLYRNSGISDSGVDFYKDSSVLQKKTTGEMAIITVSKSDEGFYHCKHPERGESPKSWVSVRVSASAGYSAVIIGLSLAFLFVILMIVLILLLHFKKKKGVEYQPPSTVNQDTSQPADGENVYENVAVRTTVDSAAGSSSTSMCSQVVTRKKKQNDDAVRRPGDVIYSQIEMKNVNPHSKDDSASRPSDVVYSMIASKNMRPNDDASKLDDVTYADIDLKKTKKPNRKQGKRTEGADTVYSELKQNTDKGDFTETADATYAQVRKKGKKYNAG
ncbi:Fc receptor-like protein 5 isoform X8 [Ictalurus punctatus]|uniref:Fc receptor-like protein 5 isoform X8 n=1 Tax=Ictalurus punctatus TaxID=7998 RepID=A0A9F7TL94_ICTPU|nr:Fc receptor-like protein 5 isoform X8 [Ictalurus punctatus]